MARMSDMKSPHCVGGGVAHGPRGGIDWSFKINKKVLALGNTFLYIVFLIF